MKILFHDNSLCLFGTSVALYDYAYYCRKLFGIDCAIVYNQNHIANHNLSIKKFESEFDIVESYRDINHLQSIIHQIKPDVFFMIKSGPYDGVISNSCKNWILGVSPRQNGIYGDKFAVASHWISQECGIKDVVPHMVNLPDVDGDMREELGIPKNAVVFGRNGGADTFDLDFVKKVVIDSLNFRDDIYFLFQGTNEFFKHDRIIHLPPSADLVTKVRFINTSDALLHARRLGESFGLTCAEFSSKNKPVITYSNSPERNHIFILAEKGIYYDSYENLMNIILNFKPNEQMDWNCYRDYLPEPVMKKFKQIYFDS
jgi:hypothetical protein